MPINAGQVIESAEVLDQTQDIHSSIIPEGVVTGWTVAAGAGLDVDIVAGNGLISGFRCNSTITNNVAGLTPSTTNFIFANFAGSGDENATFTSSTTKAPVANSILIASAVTDGATVTATTDF